MLIRWFGLLLGWLAGASDLYAALQPWMEVLRDPIFPEVIIQICSFFSKPKKKNIFKYFYNRLPQARTHNNRPFSASCFPSPCSDDLRGSNNEASSSMKSLAPRHGQIRAAGLFHLVIFKDDIHSLSAFRYCLHPDFLPSLLPLFSPSCDSMMKRSPLNWKTVIKMRWVLFTSVHEGKPAQLSWLIKS